MARPARLLAAIACLACLAGRGLAATPLGYWFTEDRGGIVRIEQCGEATLCGTIVGLRDWPANGQLLDWQGHPRCHFNLLRGLRAEDDGRWHGTVTNPEDGRTYTAEVWVPADGVLRLRGYVGLELFGSTEHWPPSPGGARQDCHYLR